MKPNNTKQNKNIITKIKQKVVESVLKKALSQTIDVIIEQQSTESNERKE